MRRSHFGVGIAIVPLVWGCQVSSSSNAARQMHGRPAPDFELVDLDGSAVSLSGYRGKPILVAFFGYG